jgi:hypothetical protein
MAADRDNPQVAHLCEPFNPAVFRLLHHVVKACVSAGKPVTLCGEMAGRPRCLLPLLGMGITRLSMTPAVMPTVREAVSRTRLETCCRGKALPDQGHPRGAARSGNHRHLGELRSLNYSLGPLASSLSDSSRT